MARDFFHQVVREALEAEGWTITADLFIIKTIGLRLEIDLPMFTNNSNSNINPQHFQKNN